MKLRTILWLFLLALLGLTAAQGKIALAVSPRVYAAGNQSLSTHAENFFTLTDFGAVGDGVADDGPALQSALDAMGESGGGTLFVPAGRYAIITPVQKDFTGVASDISILGVESLTPVPPANSNGLELTRGLDLLSEFAPRTGEQGISINIIGLRSFLIKDITFIGTPGVNNDALITLPSHSPAHRTALRQRQRRRFFFHRRPLGGTTPSRPRSSAIRLTRPQGLTTPWPRTSSTPTWPRIPPTQSVVT